LDATGGIVIKHIVLWKLKPQAEGASKAENAKKIREVLEPLELVIPEVQHLEVGINIDDGNGTADVVLYSIFDNPQALEAYMRHPAHVQAAEFVRRVVSDRVAIDYEL
jgi:hypothetical protein